MSRPKEREKCFGFVTFCLWILVIGNAVTDVECATVTKLEPSEGSLGGETRLTISGSGFSADQFSENEDPSSGNKVYLVGESGTEVSCPVHRDGSTEIQVQCYTPERMTEQYYYVKVVVDGKVVSDSNLCGGNPTSSKCRYKPKSDKTPTIDSLSPQSGTPGQMVTMKGKLYSDRYGSNIEAALNGRAEKLLRIFVGPQDCAMKENDTLFGLALDAEDSDMGSLTCKSKGTSVGFFNASYIIESPFGRSAAASDIYRVSTNDDIYLFQIYTDITSISPSSGSTSGGLTLTIHGNYFDDRSPYAAPKAYIGDTECKVTNVVVDQYIECTVAPDPQYTGSQFEGNRGVKFEYWTGTTKSASTMDDILALTSSSPGYATKQLDETYFYDTNNTMDNYVSRMTTLFTPPHDGVYKFQIKGNDGAKLFVDKVEVAKSTGSWATGNRMQLNTNTKYLLEVVHYDTSDASFVHVRAQYFNTTFTNSWTGKASQELQRIAISSTVKYDVQVLSFSNFAKGTATKEVQTVSVDTPGQFRFGLYGVYTVPLDLTADDSKIMTAFNNLPIFGSEESATVVRNPSASTASFTFTFDSKRGDFPDIEVVKVANSSSVSSSVTEDTKGSPDMDQVALSLAGTVSKPFAVSELSNSKLKAALEDMFSARCPAVFESASTKKIYLDYETSSGNFNGHRAMDTEPFCGRYSLRNPSRIFQVKKDELGISPSQYKTVCFAYKGILKSHIGLKFSSKDMTTSETNEYWRHYTHTFQKDSATKSSTWYYTCFDMQAAVMSSRATDTNHRVEEIWVHSDSPEYIYIDALFIGRATTITEAEVTRLRLPPAMPNDALINSVDVSSSGSDYTVTLTPFDCGNQFPLFELANGRVTSGRTSSPSTSATLALENGGSGRVGVSRTSFASPPVTGFIDATYNGNSKRNLNVSLEADAFQKELESVKGIGALSVEKNGDCANFHMDITFVTLPGDLPEMMVTYGNLQGIDAQGSMSTRVDGHLKYDPLTGDMVSTVHDKAQVRLFINNVPVACSTDCSFEWTNAATSSVTAISPTTGTSALSTSATITGTGFSSTNGDNTVMIGGVACTVTAATATSITCNVGNGPVGDHKVIVTVKGKGDAKHTSGDVMFTYGADITGINPTSGSLGGGVTLTISGYGFKTGANVTINSARCEVLTVQPDSITCLVPPTTSGAGTHDVVVVSGASTLTFSSYQYDAGVTATVSSVVPSSLGVEGGTVTINGASFGSSERSVFLDTQAVNVVSWSDTAVVIQTGKLSAGNQQIKLETSNGYAVDGSSSIPQLTVDLSVTNVFPTSGSHQGGTRLTITGSGFGTNTSNVEVTVGATTCTPETVTASKITCMIASAGTVHKVTNNGIHRAYGIYYAFDKPQLTVERGDTVQWSWTTPSFVNDIAHGIIEVDTASSTEAKVGGFNSGTPSREGQWQYQFNDLGTYYVWSGYVDQYAIKNYGGQIDVVEVGSRVAEVSVKVSGKEAPHNVGGASDPTDSSSCQSLTSTKSGCSDARPTASISGKFNFAFWTCSTPIVNSIDQKNGTVQTTITISGEGMSSTNCQNEISVGDSTCDVISSTDTTVTCKVAKSGEPQLGLLHPISVRVGNRGNVLFKINNMEDRSFGLLPNIEDIQPSSGSMAGGAKLTITGFGFGNSSYVTIGGFECAIISSTYAEIVCETPSSTSQAQKDVDVQIMVNGSPLSATCETVARKCTYSFAKSLTASVSSITPDAMSGSTSFAIVGELLGSTASDLEVTIGGATATVTTANDTALEATIANVPAGNNEVIVRVKNQGKASGNLVVSGTPVISSVNPTGGSIYGNTLITITGNGFVDGKTTVLIDSDNCTIQSTSLSEVTCITPAHAAGSANVAVTSNGQAYTTDTFNYGTGTTPTITSVLPIAGLAGTTLTISGANLVGGTVTVNLDGVPCPVTSTGAAEIQCTLGNHATGSVPVHVHVSTLGDSNVDVTFEYELSLTDINPKTGGVAGGQTVVLTGTGFENTSAVTICGEPCPMVSATSTSFTCKTPSVSAQTCDVAITVNSLTKTLAATYTYDASLTPTVTSVSPRRGGTGGGITITVQGTGFGTTKGDVNVRIDGAACVVVGAVIDTELECETGPHAGSISATVEVEVAGNGIAQEGSSGDAAFDYIDVWSSPYTWGGGPLPAAGEFIVIPAGMTLLLDTDTPVLKFLLIQGGKLIFDEKNVELQSEIIMITDNGVLQVGTEAQPFQHKGIITLHGHHRSKELPIYGTKVLAVRNGTLDLHGIEVPMTWTRLANTAAQGSSTVELVNPVEWNVGDEVVIAATGHHHSQSENEKKTITAISVDKRTLTLDSNLDASHLGTEETFDGTLVELRGEVGLLTHNVVVRGNVDPQWTEEITACKAGFNTGEFATQTCFLGRFGDEIGSSQFGAMILVHAPVANTHEAQARISYTEVTFAGQAFRLGRYPIHFHLNGDMSTSYVRGCGIHHTFNRAVNIHGTHNTIVEKTVIYNIMGGAFFLEDGIETGNTLQYNLAVFVRESSSLLNDDVTPASYWVTNPNNTIQHNAAAGGSHFGYWYRMHAHPEGPSATDSVCPDKQPLGVFENNTAHSFGWFGLWMFTNYFPVKDGCGGGDVEPAVFKSLTAWNCEKGAEAVNSGSMQFENFILVQNKKAGYEGKLVMQVPLYTDDSPMIKDSLIVGTTTVAPDNTQGSTGGGIVFPYGAGFRVKNVRFVNFASPGSAAFRWTRIDGTCGFLCGGYNYETEGLSFINAPNRGIYAWDWEGIIVDKDGSATGKSADWKVVPTTGSLPSDCEPAAEYSIGAPASYCPANYKFHRFAFNNPIPESLEGKDFLITNQWGSSVVEFAKKRLTHKPGWMCALVGGATYEFSFVNAEQIKNISYTGAFYGFESSDYITIRLKVKEYPDRFSIDGGKTFINASTNLDPASGKYGDWEWDNTNSEIKFLVHGTKRSRRAALSTYSVDRPLQFTSYKCYYQDCIPPPDPNTVPPAANRPNSYKYWSDNTLWNASADGYITTDTDRNSSYGVPVEYDNVKILYGEWVVVNVTSPAKLGILLLEGVLEFIDTPGANYELNAEHIIIMGGRLVIGWPEEPFQALANIVLRGNHSSAIYNAGDGPQIGSKAIGVFGGLDLFGKDVGLTWTQLSATAGAGTNQIILADAVNWTVGDDIVVGPTSYNVWQTETFKISAISPDKLTLTLNDSLQYSHVAHSETINGKTIELGGSVGLLTRNIKIIGEDYSDLYKESFGARVIVGLVTTSASTYGGYARLSNVEFYHTGQEGYTEEYDPRFSVSYVATGTVSDIKPSFVTKCAFHNGFNSAIGAFGIGSLNITDNVVHHSVGHAIRTSSDDTRIIHNMVALVVWTGAYQDREEPFNFRWEAGIEAMEAKTPVIQDNLVSGSERFGYHVQPLACTDNSGSFTNNRAQANVIGIGVLPEDKMLSDCVKFVNFTSWKSNDFGLYYQNAPGIQYDNIVSIENRNGIWNLIIGPGAMSHIKGDKKVEVSNTIFVGVTASYDCVNDVSPSGDTNLALSLGSAPLAPSGGMIGMVFANFLSGGNSAPTKPFKGTMAYNAIGGLVTLDNVAFAHYGSSCKGDYAVATNAGNDDGQHPIESRGVTLVDVAEDYKIIYHRPNVGKINSADCVDMDCDALKKALFKDLDGTFLGSVGAVVPQSEYEWGGDPRRGLGDYRIPKEMVTTLDGTRIPYSTLMPNKGIIRGNNCTYIGGWQAYKCFGYNYEMLIIESMDPDTETRRLSPVAVLGDGYIDLINGPQDHGWCSGYTCRKRVSTFMALVATGFDYLIHFTSTTPFNLRYYLLNTGPTDAIKITTWYSRSNRLDVFVDGTYKMSTNARINSKGYYVVDMPQGDEFTPVVANDTGTNYIDIDAGLLSIIIKGPQVIDVVTRDVIVVSFGLPAMTVADFYGDNMIENLAAFLNVPATKVRIVNVVSASASGRRRRRSSTGVVVEVEIGDEPSTTINGTVSSSITPAELTSHASAIVDECQVGNLSSSLNVTGGCESVTVPATSASETIVTYSTPSPVQLVFTAMPTPEHEGVPLQVQPKVQAVDISNVVVTELGTNEYPWKLTVSLRTGTGHPDAVLSGTVEVNATNGWFNFTDLSISHMGTGYILDFNVTEPAVAVNFTLATSPFDVAGRPVKVNVFDMTSGEIVQNSAFTVTLDLRDTNTDAIIPDIYWRKHTWTVTATLIGTPVYCNLTGSVTQTFDSGSGQAFFPSLTMTGVGVYYVQFEVVSSPSDYNLTVSKQIPVINPSHVGMVPENTSDIEIKFDMDFNTVLPTTDKQGEFIQKMIEEYANMWPDLKITSGAVRSGSIILTFTVSGSFSNVNSTAHALCDSIYNNTAYSFNGYSLTLAPYMTIANVSYYGVSCHVTSDDSDDDGLHVGIIAAIAVVGFLIVVAVVILVVWKCCIQPKTKTHNVHNGTHYIGSTKGKGGSAEDFLFREDTFNSLKFNMGAAKNLPPAGTGINYGGYLNEQRPTSGLSASGLSIHASTPAMSTFTKRSMNVDVTDPRSPSPAYLEPSYTPTYVDPPSNDKSSSHSSRSGTPSSRTPMVQRSHSPFSDRESPLPPVGNNLYHGEYITKPVPRQTTPHLPAPNPKF